MTSGYLACFAPAPYSIIRKSIFPGSQRVAGRVPDRLTLYGVWRRPTEPLSHVTHVTLERTHDLPHVEGIWDGLLRFGFQREIPDLRQDRESKVALMLSSGLS